MHRLNRPPQEPPALAKARKACANDWEKLNYEQRAEIRSALLAMQHGRCAYCECSVSDCKDKGHIEHFRKRSLYPDLTFCWDNLFYSCVTGNTCGRHKDANWAKSDCAEDLIDPCKDNPEDFFGFDHQGRIFIKDALSEKEHRRAEFTIKAFNLNEPTLVAKRRNRLRACQSCSSVEERDYILRSALEDCSPFVTAIFHYFGHRVDQFR